MKLSSQSSLQFQLIALCLSQTIGQQDSPSKATTTVVPTNISKQQLVLVDNSGDVTSSLSVKQDTVGHSIPTVRRTLQTEAVRRTRKKKARKSKKIKSKVKTVSPTIGSIVDPTEGVIVLEADAKDPRGVVEVTFQLRLDDGPVVLYTASPSETANRFEVELLDLVGGDYTWTAEMETVSGAKRLSREVEFQVLDVEDVKVATTASIVRGLQPDCSVIDSDRFIICLDLDFPDDVDPAFLDAFGTAKAKWESVIVNSSSDDTFTMSEERHGSIVSTTVPDFPINDIYIAASAELLDGPGDVVATAGPLDGRRVGGFVVPTVGLMKIDSQDIESLLQDSDLLETLMHEMAHILGIGTAWVENSLHSGLAGDDKYNGANALREWRNMGCSGGLPVETDFGEGTALGHWDELCMDHELLTGITHASRPNSQKLSRMTIGALADLGYNVNYDAAEEYTIDDLGSCNDNGKNYCPEHQDPVRRKLRLPSSSPRSAKRKLSADGMKKAKMAAAKELKDRREQHSTAAEDEVYFGADLLTVYVMEEEEIKIAMVTWDEVKDLAERL